MADWFTDADVQAVAELMVTQHAYLDVAKMLHWRDYEPEARDVMATLGPRIAQEQAAALRQAAQAIDTSPCPMCHQVAYEPCDHSPTLLWGVRELRARADEIENKN